MFPSIDDIWGFPKRNSYIAANMNKNEEITLEIESLSGDGHTVGKYEGMVVFVDHALPGDTVRARVLKVKKNFVEAVAVEVLKPSPHRITPRCKHFGICGGCRWQNLDYVAQLENKQRIVADAFHRIGGFPAPDVRPVLGAPADYWYRNKMEFTFSDRRWLTDDEMKTHTEHPPEVALGLHIPGRYDKVLNVEECWLQSETSARIVNVVREICRAWELSVYSTRTHTGYLRHLMIRDGKRTGELMVNLVTTTDWSEAMSNMTKLLLKEFPGITTIVNNITDRKSMVAFGDREKIYHGPGHITEKLGPYVFRISANSFFQTNTLQAEVLYTRIRDLAGFRTDDVVHDLYSGTGTIAIFISDAVERVVGVEMVAEAIADSERNVALNRIPNCYFLQGDLAEKLTRDSGWLKEHPSPTVVITDPPRSGMHEKVVKQIAAMTPDRIVYVSCNPATQARDARLLADRGYELAVVQPVDMFPHTDHIEAVALFKHRR